jgi:hypothetical protein
MFTPAGGRGQYGKGMILGLIPSPLLVMRWYEKAKD